MAQFSANLTMLFNELPFLDRFRAARLAGFRAVEYVSPYEYYPGDISDRLKANRLKQVLFNLPVGDWGAGERGIAIFPERRSDFRDGIATAIRYAKALDCPQVNCLAGIAPDDADARVMRETLVENLRYASAELQSAGIRLLMEPINTRDMPGFFLNSSQQAIDLIRDVGSPNLFLQYDVYHMHIMEGETLATIARHLPLIKHVQIADHPGRHEPGTGEIDFPTVLRHLDAIGYDGWIGAEYKPKAATTDGLGWLTTISG
ncbi:MAG TPA: hydroxypyruvate isomerase [Hyphomicrobium sp.]|nr:hydroxypyruvate isomerase [Hyphomicrobium sp.]